MNKIWVNTSLGYLFVVAILGTVLRFLSIGSFGLNYSNLLHAHSHIAFLGWLYNILFVILINTYLATEFRIKRVYKNMFWLTQFTNVAILVSFLLQGYGLFSIAASTLHILLSYWFAFQFLRDAQRDAAFLSRHYLSFRFVKAAVLCMVISSLGPLSLGSIIAFVGKGSDLYYNAIYFYLHFQYNGWFTFAVLGLYFWVLEKHEINFSFKKGNIFYYCMVVSCVPAYLLSVLWIKPGIAIYIIAAIAALLQTFGLFVFIVLTKEIKEALKNYYEKWLYYILFIALFCFSLKIVLQQICSIPIVIDRVKYIRDFIVGYLHLVFIGFVSLYILIYLIRINEIKFNQKGKTSIILFLVGFFIGEIILFTQGFLMSTCDVGIPYYQHLLFYGSLIMTFGAALLFFNQIATKRTLEF